MGSTTLFNLGEISRFPHASQSVSFSGKEARLMGFPCFKSYKESYRMVGGVGRVDMIFIFVHGIVCISLRVGEVQLTCKQVRVCLLDMSHDPGNTPEDTLQI